MGLMTSYFLEWNSTRIFYPVETQISNGGGFSRSLNRSLIFIRKKFFLLRNAAGGNRPVLKSQVTPRVYDATVAIQFEMQVRSRAQTGVSGNGDALPFGHRLAGAHTDLT